MFGEIPYTTKSEKFPAQNALFLFISTGCNAGWTLGRLGDAFRLTGQYEKAVHEYKKAIQLQPDDMFSHLNLALYYLKLEREADAHAEAAEVLRINPKFSAKSYAKLIALKDEASKKLLIDGMRKAGLPE